MNKVCDYTFIRWIGIVYNRKRKRIDVVIVVTSRYFWSVHWSSPDPPENCHLNVKKFPKTRHFFQKKNCEKFSFFQKNCQWPISQLKGDFTFWRQNSYCYIYLWDYDFSSQNISSFFDALHWILQNYDYKSKCLPIWEQIPVLLMRCKVCNEYNHLIKRILNSNFNKNSHISFAGFPKPLSSLSGLPFFIYLFAVFFLFLGYHFIDVFYSP